MKTYNEYKELKNSQNTIVDLLSDKLNSFEKYGNGMTTESAMESDEFRGAKSQYAKEFKKLQEINKAGVKLFKKEIRKDYESKYYKIAK